MGDDRGRVFGVHVLQQRQFLGLKQRQLAHLVGLSHQMISEIERGTLPSLDAACRLAAFFRVPLSALLGDAAPDPAGQVPDPIQIRVVSLCRELTLGPAELRQVMGAWLIALGSSLQLGGPDPQPPLEP